MNPWIMAATVILFCMVSPFWLCATGGLIRRLIGLEAGSIAATVILLLLAEGFHNAALSDIALALALLSFGGGLVFARFLGSWL